jgi:hypothetical protein
VRDILSPSCRASRSGTPALVAAGDPRCLVTISDSPAQNAPKVLNRFRLAPRRRP